MAVVAVAGFILIIPLLLSDRLLVGLAVVVLVHRAQGNPTVRVVVARSIQAAVVVAVKRMEQLPAEVAAPASSSLVTALRHPARAHPSRRNTPMTPELRIVSSHSKKPGRVIGRFRLGLRPSTTSLLAAAVVEGGATVVVVALVV